MTNTVIQDGQTVDYTPGSAVAVNEVVEFADSIGVALTAIAASATGSVLMDGVVEVAKETGVVFTLGDKLYWDAVNNRLDKTGTNIPAGLCWADAASGDTTARVKLNSGAS